MRKSHVFCPVMVHPIEKRALQALAPGERYSRAIHALFTLYPRSIRALSIKSTHKRALRVKLFCSLCT